MTSEMDKFTIKLKKLRFYSRIGVFEQERRVGNEFVVSVNVDIDASRFETEILESTVSYADIYEIVRRRMESEWLLVESVAKAIADDIRQTCDRVRGIVVGIDKLAPPLSGIVGECGVEYSATY